MLQEPWFWISYAGFFFVSNFYYYRSKGLLNGAKVQLQELLSSLSALGIIIFWIIGIFVANKWWQPFAALGISMASGGLIGTLIEAVLPRSASVFIGAISPFVSIILTSTLYIVWF